MRPLLTPVRLRRSSVPRNPSQTIMATRIAYTLSVLLLVVGVVIPVITGFRITNTSVTVVQTHSQIQLATLPEGYIAHNDIKVAYKIYEEAVTSKVARERCIHEGADLAIIDTDQKVGYLRSQTQQPVAAWVGIHRMYDGTEWASISTGSMLNNLPWAPHEPFGDYDCVMTSASDRGLRNFACNIEYYYVCQLSILVIRDAQENDVSE